MTTKKKHEQPRAWADLLHDAVNEPGRMATCYRMFHDYSFGNMMLAAFQIEVRGLPMGPIATYRKWSAVGRQVTRGQKAIVLCQPVTVKKETEDGEEAFTMFTYRAKWFTLAQTEGEDVELGELPGFSFDKALKDLDITKVPFEHLDGNCQGYAQRREVAVNPVAARPERTLLHEMAHVVLGHTSDGGRIVDGETLGRDLRELEAEAVAYLISDAFGLPGADESRGYIQAWFKGNEVPEKHATRIMSAANKILTAGKEE